MNIDPPAAPQRGPFRPLVKEMTMQHVTDDIIIQVADELQDWCDRFDGGWIPTVSLTITSTITSAIAVLAIGEIDIWDSDNGFADLQYEKAPVFDAGRCIACYKQVLAAMTAWPK
jgi:hypothetical protein